MAITVKEMARRLNSLNIIDELDAILLELSDVITGMNKEQLSVGQDAVGNLLSPNLQNAEYAFDKVDFGGEAPLGIADLHNEGNFYDGFKIIIGNTTITITSSDIKTLDLEGKYGDIFGIQQDKLTELSIVYILPRLQQRVRQLILG